MISDDSPRPSDEQLVEELKEAMSEFIQELKSLQGSCSSTPAGQAAREHLQRQIESTQKLLYGALYGCEPPCDLPDNWVAK